MMSPNTEAKDAAALKKEKKNPLCFSKARV